MGRTVKSFMLEPHWPQRADTAEVAPHRYTWEGGRPTLDSFGLDRWKEMMDSVVYQPGDVIWMTGGPKGFVKAMVLSVFVSRSAWDGCRREKYRVVRATAKGEWSKLWEETYPGFVQRGYVAAGMAPDCEGKV